MFFSDEKALAVKIIFFEGLNFVCFKYISTLSFTIVKFGKANFDFTSFKNRVFLLIDSIAITCHPKIAKTTDGKPARYLGL